MRYWLVLLAVLAWRASAAETVLELRKDAQVRGPMMVLSELVLMDAASPLASTAVGRAPLPGRVALRSRQELADVLARQPQWRGKAIAWRGAESVRIHAEAEMMPGERLVAEAVRYLQENFGARYARLEVVPVSQVADIPVSTGRNALRVRPLQARMLPGRVAVWIDVLAGDAVQRSVVVPLQVEAWQEVLVARHPVAEGSAVGEADFEASLQRVDGLADEPAAGDALRRGGMLRHRVAAGQVLLRRDLAPAGAVLRGQRVRLLAGGPGLTVEVAAVAEADGLEGQAIAVRPVNGGGTVMARITGPGEVRIDER